MAFRIEYSSAAEEYLRGYEGLSREGRIKLAANVTDYVRSIPDDFRTDPVRRLADSAYFQVGIIFSDPHSARRRHHFRFVVDDSAAAYGVLRVVYIDASDSGPSPP